MHFVTRLGNQALGGSEPKDRQFSNPGMRLRLITCQMPGPLGSLMNSVAGKLYFFEDFFEDFFEGRLDVNTTTSPWFAMRCGPKSIDRA